MGGQRESETQNLSKSGVGGKIGKIRDFGVRGGENGPKSGILGGRGLLRNVFFGVILAEFGFSGLSNRIRKRPQNVVVPKSGFFPPPG